MTPVSAFLSGVKSGYKQTLFYPTSMFDYLVLLCTFLVVFKILYTLLYACLYPPTQLGWLNAEDATMYLHFMQGVICGAAACGYGVHSRARKDAES